MDLKKVDQIYNDYASVMSQVHKRLNAHYKRMISECFSDERREQLGSFADTEPLRHPGDDSDEDDIRNAVLEERKHYPSDSISLNSSYSDDDHLFVRKRGNRAPVRPAGDEEESKRGSLFLENSPQPHNNEDAVLTPSVTYEDISVNEEFLEHHAESDKVEGINDKIIVGSIHILNTKDKKFMNKKIPPFSERLERGDPHYVGKFILLDLGKISAQLKRAWRKIIKAIQLEPRFVIENLKMDFEVKHMEKIGQCIFLSTLETDDFVSPIEENLLEIHQELLKNRESKNYHHDLDTIVVQDQEIWKNPVSHPILFEE